MLTSSANAKAEFDNLMLDKFIALDEDKCQFTYQLITALGATNVVEAGTSFGVSTIYLALAVGKAKATTGKEGKVIATEKEAEKAERARAYWKECGEDVEREIDLREGDLLETLKTDVPEVDLLLLDSKFGASYGDGWMAFGRLIISSLGSARSSHTEDHPAASSTRCCRTH